MPAPIKNGNTTIELIKCVPFNGETEQILFKNITDQNRYFSCRVIQTKWYDEQGVLHRGSRILAKLSYQRYEYVARVNINKEDIYDDVNYMRFKNSDNHKWIYAYVTDMHWNNSSECDIFFNIDSWQSYMFNIKWKTSLVRRETPNTDEFGQNQEREEISFSNYIEKGIPLKFEDNEHYTLNSKFISQIGKFTAEQVRNFNLMPCCYIMELQSDFKGPAEIFGNSPLFNAGLDQNGVASSSKFLFFPYITWLQSFINVMFNGIGAEDYSKILNIYSVPAYPFLCSSEFKSGTIAGKNIQYRENLGMNLILVNYQYTTSFPPSLTTGQVYQVLNLDVLDSATQSQPVRLNYPMTVKAEINLKGQYIANNIKSYYSPYVTITLETQNDTINVKPEALTYDNGTVTLSMDFYASAFHATYALYLNQLNYDRVLYSGTYTRKENMYKVSLPLFPTTNSYVDATSQWWRQNSFRTIANLTLAAASIGIGFGAIGSETVLGSALAGGAALSLPSTAKGGTRSNNERNDYQVMGGVAAGVNEIGKIYQASMSPDYQVGSVNGIDVFSANTSLVKLTISVLIPDEIKQCDDFFSIFGYAKNELKMPDFVNQNGIGYGGSAFACKRKYWYYCQTAICNISSPTEIKYNSNYQLQEASLLSGNLVPLEHIEKIKLMFNNGIRLWLFNDNNNFDTNVLNYGLKNEII